MREFLRTLKNENFDGLNFYRNHEGNLEVDGFSYKNPGEKLVGSEMGDLYDIIIFPEEPPKMPERFKAILISPLDYISTMIDTGFLGVVAKATTTSDTVLEDVFEHMSSRAAEYIEYYESLQNDE
jgi:hypothetical protein